MERAVRYSKKREAILAALQGTNCHPSAEWLYRQLKPRHPDLSLGTVYRNLSLLTELGEIRKISTGIGPDRFDGNTSPHYHVLCTGCGSVMDLKMENIDHINIIAGNEFEGRIHGHITYFLGTCRDCMEKEKNKNIS